MGAAGADQAARRTHHQWINAPGAALEYRRSAWQPEFDDAQMHLLRAELTTRGLAVQFAQRLLSRLSPQALDTKVVATAADLHVEP